MKGQTIWPLDWAGHSRPQNSLIRAQADITLNATPHPRFPNPTIAQATCEIGFNRDLQAKLSSAELYKLVVADFPEIQAVGGMAFQIVVGSGPQLAQMPPPGVPAPTFRFATAAGDQFIQISDTSFVYQSTAAYPGWDAVKAAILDLWVRMLPVVKPDGVTKVGLRYINRIARDKQHPYIGDWLSASAYIPPLLLASRRHFLSRVEASPGDNDLLLITVADQELADTPHGAVIFDIDRICSDAIAADPNVVGEVLERLHQEVWDVFWTSRTPALEQRLNAKS